MGFESSIPAPLRTTILGWTKCWRIARSTM